MGATPINAIETKYAGCLFRSRTEARWAVFFDFIGIRWIYEVEGFHIGMDLEGTVTRKYLPDFYLPDNDVWVEIKGTHSQFDFGLIAAAVIPNGGGLPESRILLLDAIPQDSETIKSWPMYWFDKGDIWFSQVRFRLGAPSQSARRMLHTRNGNRRPCVDFHQVTEPVTVGNDATWSIRPAPPTQTSARHDNLRDAYAAARSARFEHGQSGAR